MNDVKTGDKLQLTAPTWNAHNAVARWFQMQRPNGTPNNELPAPSVLVSAFADAVLPYGSAVIMTPPASLGLTDVNGMHFLEESAVEIAACQPGNGFSPIGIVYESPADDGQIVGSILTGGLAVVRVESSGYDADHTHLRCGANGLLRSGRIGRHKIIGWLDDVAGEYCKFALAQINGDLHNTADILIGTPTALIADRKWEYAWTEKVQTDAGWTDVDGGMDDTQTGFTKALNRAEAGNTAGATVQGNGADFNAEPLISYPSIIMRPIRGASIREARFTISSEDGTVLCAFQADNAVQGPCE
jgi:hypothetical protein